MSPTTRLHDDVPDDHESKKARTTEQKRQRIERLSVEYSNMIRGVKVANDEFYTMDEYDADLQVENEFDAADPWWDEDQVKVDQMPMELWSDHTIDDMPPQPPSWVDDLADKIEIERLKSMGVMIEEELFNGPPINSKLTTKHVHDWRLKPL